MESNISIRHATVEDIFAIQYIAFSTWPVAYSAILSQEQLDYMLDLFYNEDALKDQMKNGHTFLVAEFNNEIIGFASFNFISDQTYKLQKL
ncbi:MAG: N-acetyltransferase, partial [Bacteroidota bacterium]|nr:N-acetyltransferase [Bacteroidota bacterium]